jgi:hypothetical protein
LPINRPALCQAERREHRDLVILLAEELYRRDHGRSPTSENDLVATYLPSLPDDGSAELDDGMTPTVDDSAVSGPKLLPE